ncbi:hypothetical protein HDU86_005794 [Geranomyces michiganensis]|nr:hypothetical protein HDU86_005794 [Geranomyces michiganensis]
MTPPRIFVPQASHALIKRYIALDKAGNSPLHWACRGGHAAVVQLLLERKPAVNSQNKLGDTPLHLAAWGGHAAVLSMLLSQAGIDTRLRNNDGKTALELAKTDEAAATLVNAGQDTGLEEDHDEDDD